MPNGPDSEQAAGMADVAYSRARRRLMQPVFMTWLTASIVATTYVGYQRIGTVANADAVETTANLAGGFMALGRTEDQPGFLLLSALDRKAVTVEARQYTHFLAGTHTRLSIATPADAWSRRLRRPVVITIDHAGHIRTETVDWTWYTFQTLADAVDCGHASPPLEKHCGAPFLDLRARIAKWPPDAIPGHLRTFLAAP